MKLGRDREVLCCSQDTSVSNYAARKRLVMERMLLMAKIEFCGREVPPATRVFVAATRVSCFNLFGVFNLVKVL